MQPKNRTNRCRACAGFVILSVGLVGCGTTRVTDTQRAASEMLLVSQAIDNAIAEIDFAPLDGKTVFLDVQYLDGTVDKGYLVSSLRQHLLAHGAMLMEERTKAQYVVEPRSGAIGTDKNSLLVGTPALTLPAVIPTVPTSIPEIALVKKTDQRGVAKIAVFAYNRQTGRALWQSGLAEANSTLKDTWVFGAGPYSRGSIRRRDEFAGEPLPKLPMPFAKVADRDPDEPVTTAAASDPEKPRVWATSDVPSPRLPMPAGVLGVVGGIAGDNPVIPLNPPSLPHLPVAPTGIVEPPLLPRPMLGGAKP
jgi:hypothetical protein